MVNERTEPTLSNLALNTNDESGDKRGSHAKDKRLKQPQVIVKKQPSVLLWFTFFLVMASIAGTAYLFVELQASQSVVSLQQSRINTLEQKLALSDDESTQSLTALTANVKALSKDTKLSLAEVDKLWATRNVNRKAIADLKQSQDSNATNAEKSLSALEKKFSEPVSSLQKQLAQKELLIQSLRERTAEQEQQLEQLVRVNNQLAKLPEQLKSLSKKVSTNAEAVKAIDAFRRTVNRDILALKQRTGAAPVAK